MVGGELVSEAKSRRYNVVSGIRMSSIVPWWCCNG